MYYMLACDDHSQNELGIYSVDAHIFVDISCNELYLAWDFKTHSNSKSYERISNVDASVRIDITDSDRNAVLCYNYGLFGNAGGVCTPADEVVVLTLGFFGKLRCLTVCNELAGDHASVPINEGYKVVVDFVQGGCCDIRGDVIKICIPTDEGIAGSFGVRNQLRILAVKNGYCAKRCSVPIEEGDGVLIAGLFSRYGQITFDALKLVVPACEGIAFMFGSYGSCCGIAVFDDLL